MYKFIIVFLTLIFSTTCGSFEKPDFCGSLECPEYVTMSKEGDVEIREYLDSYWVTYETKGEDKSSGFMTLFNYINGNNETKEKMKMTAPVLRKINAKIPFASDENTSKMSFFLGEKYQSEQTKAPKPLSENTYLEKTGAKIVGVIYYSGFSSKDREREMLVKLGDQLIKMGAKFNTDYYFTAGYDSPAKLLFRHNELWVDLIVE